MEWKFQFLSAGPVCQKGSCKVWIITQTIKCLSCKLEDLSSIPHLQKKSQAYLASAGRWRGPHPWGSLWQVSGLWATLSQAEVNSVWGAILEGMLWSLQIYITYVSTHPLLTHPCTHGLYFFICKNLNQQPYHRGPQQLRYLPSAWRWPTTAPSPPDWLVTHKLLSMVVLPCFIFAFKAVRAKHLHLFLLEFFHGCNFSTMGFFS